MGENNGAPKGNDEYFRKARNVGGLALIGAAVVIALVDVWRTDVTADVWQFGLILGGGLLLLGVQGLDRFIKP